MKLTAMEVALVCRVAVGLVDHWVNEAISERGAAHYAGIGGGRERPSVIGYYAITNFF